MPRNRGAPVALRPDARVVGLFVASTVVLGYLVPGGGLLVAFGALATDLRYSRGVILLLFSVGGVLALVVLVTFLGTFVPPVAHVESG